MNYRWSSNSRYGVDLLEFALPNQEVQIEQQVLGGGLAKNGSIIECVRGSNKELTSKGRTTPLAESKSGLS